MDVLIFFAFVAVVSLVSFLIVKARWGKRRTRRPGPGSGTPYGTAGYLDFDSRDSGGSDGGGGCGSGGGD